jgi:DNA repair exonuclease SbcCD nuclease subunit
MLKFLHLGDIHLGNNQYQNDDRMRDFFYALHAVTRRYAIDEKVDFVLVAGDLFDRRNIEPRVLTQATLIFKELKDAGIPVYAIEGNHDRSGPHDGVSWLRYLSDWDWFSLLEPDHGEDGSLTLSPWDGRRGGYLEHQGVRIIGSKWYGSSTAAVIGPLAKAIADLPPCPAQILLFHAGLEGYIDSYSGGLSHHQLLPLKEAGVTYLALGHIHKRYEEGNWIYNPGSTESCNVAEFAETRGAYLVEVDPETGRHTARHIDHRQFEKQRPFQRIRFDVSGHATPESVLAALEGELAASKEPYRDRPVVEVTLAGVLGFKRHELELSKVEALVDKHLDPLLVRLRYDAVPAEYAVAPGVSVGTDRKQLEREIMRDLVARDARYGQDPDRYSQILISLKNRALAGDAPADIAGFVAVELAGQPLASQLSASAGEG